jgi:dsRNA-specific ribonuclease
MRIEVREANTSTPERPLWVWNVYSGNREIGKGFSPSEKEANKQAKLAISRAPRSHY